LIKDKKNCNSADSVIEKHKIESALHLILVFERFSVFCHCNWFTLFIIDLNFQDKSFKFLSKVSGDRQYLDQSESLESDNFHDDPHADLVNTLADPRK